MVKLCTQVGYVKSQYTDDKPSLKWASSGSHDPFSILTPAIISPEGLKRESPNFVYRYNISSASLGMTDYPLVGVVRVMSPFLKSCAQSYIWNRRSYALQISCADRYRRVFLHTRYRPIYYPRKGCVQSHVTSFKFWEISDNISLTRQDGRLVTMESEIVWAYGLSNDAIANTLESPWGSLLLFETFL